MITFHDYKLALSKVIGIGPLKTISIGSRLCDWTYGFDIFMNGNTIEIKVPEPKRHEYPGDTEDRHKAKTIEWINEFSELCEINGIN